ncbi:hypothetical protein ITJ44_15495 [Clavibacter sp. VKM Ac-2873]|uniref:hypothetical protein n=1 Tax=Clavibacter sp. VKM Ac-2873 TaxID=2783813 RepID=UPI001889D1DD|nr:hypothetical protein [Clavibacter sp. VKM Ac-2873]MBF4619481.1 hypothetical protein [Clavibacter sp. VKM Ac-2873]
MPVSAADFKRWASDNSLASANAPLAQAIGLGRMALHRQLASGWVQERTVIAAARAVSANPVDVLSTFVEYEDLRRGVMAPTRAEVLAQVTLDDASAALLRRRSGHYAARLRDERIHQNPPQPNSVQGWLDAIAAGDLRHRLSECLDMPAQRLSRHVDEKGMTVRHLVEVARVARTSLTGGLAAAGIITLQEAGWPDRVRERAIGFLSETELMELVRARLASAHRAARRHDEDEAAARRIEESLG